MDASGKLTGIQDVGVRAAQLKVLGDPATSHPSLWAPFVLVGDGGTP